MKFRVIFAFILPFVLFEETISQGTTTPNIGSTTPKNQTTEVILLGYNDFSFKNKIVHFFVHIRIPRFVISPSFITLFIYVLKGKRNIRLLAEQGDQEEMKCQLDGKDDDKFKFKCDKELTSLSDDGKVSKITIDENSIKVDGNDCEINPTPGAIYLRDKMLDIDPETADFFVKTQIPMNNCEKKIEGNNLIIEGDFNENQADKDSYAIIVNDGKSDFKNITGKLSKTSDKYRFTTSRENQNLDFKNQLAYYSDTQNILFDFGSNSGETDTSNEYAKNYLRRQNKKSGLSTGGIIAIIIPCSVALIAVAAGVLITSRSQPQMVGSNFNTNIGDSTSGVQLKH